MANLRFKARRIYCREKMLKLIIFFILFIVPFCSSQIKPGGGAQNPALPQLNTSPGPTQRYAEGASGTTTMKDFVKVTKVTYPRHIQNQFKKVIMGAKQLHGPKSRIAASYNSAWMDYCDPYHCNDYHKQVCGLNRKTMRFRYFQSGCHLILNNQCASFRGALKYDLVELKFCRIYVMFLRNGCPLDCNNEKVDPVCAYGPNRGHTVLFINSCSFDAANCRNREDEYEVMDMKHCENILLDLKAAKMSADSSEESEADQK